ncbi:MAG: hypothetical protein M1837_002659 [Sclerophora amabilis]|nr:MAG: hypothetical protein M1837_002659 [Sclerophora amabilis]
MGREEQKEEREVLDSIFPEEITDISDTVYRISIKLDVVSSGQDGDEEDEAPTLQLQITYPENYPDEAPVLELSAPPNSAKYEHLDVYADRSTLMESLQPTIEENLGMAMVFSLVSTLKDSAEVLISERQASARAVYEVERAKLEEEENRKFHGTMVNRETFLQWRDNFRREAEEAERRRESEREAEEKKKRGPKEEKKMTGRELWEKGLVGRVDEDEDDDEENGREGIEALEKLKVSG